MKYINTGIVNLIINDILKKSIIDKKIITESKLLIYNYLDLLKNSPILQLEYKVYNNIENKYIENDLLASKYIDNNIKLFEIYTINEIKNEHNKLNEIISNNKIPIDKTKIDLYNSINILIYESLKNNNDVNVNKMHDAFEYVLNYIKTPKIIENNKFININENIIKLAVNKFNRKYSNLNKEDINFIKILIENNDNKKIQLLNDIKQKTINLLEDIQKTDSNDNIEKTINKIKSLEYNTNTYIKDILNLYELKLNLEN